MNFLVNTLSKQLTCMPSLLYRMDYPCSIEPSQSCNANCWSAKDVTAIHVMRGQSDVIWLYLPLKNGGRGLINITNHYKNAIINFSSYLLNSEEQFMQLTSKWQVTREEKSIHQKTAILWWNWSWYSTIGCHGNIDPEIRHQIRTHQQTDGRTQKKDYAWQLTKYLEEFHVDKDRSNQWLKSSTLKRSTESTVAAIQDWAISIKYIKKYVFNVEDDNTCRICSVEKETIHHSISGCNGLWSTNYLERHDNVRKCIDVLLLLEHGFIEKYTPLYQHQPVQVVENNSKKNPVEFSDPGWPWDYQQ